MMISLEHKEVISESKINADGLNSILKNMELLMQKYHVTTIEALGEIFNPIFTKQFL